MTNVALWNSFDVVYCLTLEGDTDRQHHASAELCGVGLSGFKFIDGIKADSDDVRQALQSGKVQRFPPCFRCGAITCGNAECNNILIEPQVGCFLSFIKIFQAATRSRSNTFLVVEDDVKFHNYAQELAAMAFTRERLECLGFFSEMPCLIGLGRGISYEETLQFGGTFEFVSRRKQPQNPCFAFNRAFAELALLRFHKISHTVDVYIHFELSEGAAHYSLEPPLAYELSSSTGELPSKIHPKQVAFENLSNSDETRDIAKMAFAKHLKHVKSVPLVVLGCPRGGTAFMAHALAQYGMDIGHEALRSDGISSWLFAVNDVNMPFGADSYACNSRFVFAEKTIAVVRTSKRAIFAMQLENSKNVQSYVFRKKWVKKHFEVDLDSFSTDFERALASYVFWYRIVALQKPSAWICLERAAQDLERLFSCGLLQKRKTPDPLALNAVINAKKPYLGQVYAPISGEFDSMLKNSDPFLIEQYRNLRAELFPVFHTIV